MKRIIAFIKPNMLDDVIYVSPVEEIICIRSGTRIV